MKEKKDYVNVRLLIFNLMLFYIYIYILTNQDIYIQDDSGA